MTFDPGADTGTNKPGQELIGLLLDGKIELVEIIGKGGAGTVYKARHRLLESDLAVKVLTSIKDESDLQSEQRFYNEAQILSSFEHENIVNFVAFGRLESGEPYIVLEYLDGKTLREVLQENKYLEPERALDIFIQIAAALSYAHEKSIVHRDIKPENIVIIQTDNTSELVKILDFGIVKCLCSSRQNLTQTGLMLGSVNYMSPEQCRGKELDGRSDLYSFACLIYETLCGIPPMAGENDLVTMSNHLHKNLDRVPAITPISKNFESLVLKALAKDPAARPGSASELLADLISLKGDCAGNKSRVSGQKAIAIAIFLLAVSAPVAISVAMSILMKPAGIEKKQIAKAPSFIRGHWTASKDIRTLDDLKLADNWLIKNLAKKECSSEELAQTYIKISQYRHLRTELNLGTTAGASQLISRLKSDLPKSLSQGETGKKLCYLVQVLAWSGDYERAKAAMHDFSTLVHVEEIRNQYLCNAYEALIALRSDDPQSYRELVFGFYRAAKGNAGNHISRFAASLARAYYAKRTGNEKELQKYFTEAYDEIIKYIDDGSELGEVRLEKFCRLASQRNENEKLLAVLNKLKLDLNARDARVDHLSARMRLDAAKSLTNLAKYNDAAGVASSLRDNLLSFYPNYDESDEAELLNLKALRMSGKNIKQLKADLNSYLTLVEQKAPERYQKSKEKLNSFFESSQKKEKGGNQNGS